MTDPTPAALADLRVVDMAGERGELCGRLLADLGADVVRVEPPGGAPSRGLPPRGGGAGLYFAYRNTNERGVGLDLARAGDRERLHRLLAGADVWIESQPPGHPAAQDLAPAAVLERHPHLVITSITDFGHGGPYRDWAATDAVLAALGAIAFKAGVPEEPPLVPPGAMASDVAATAGCFATLLACWQRRRTGAGQWIDLSALEALSQTSDWALANASFLRARGAEYPELRGGSGPLYAIYPCADGYVRLIVLSRRQWRALRAWLGEPEALQADHWDGFAARVSIADVLGSMYEAFFADKKREELCVEAQRRGIVCTPVLNPDEVLRNPHLLSRGTFREVEVARGVKGPVASGWIEIDGVRQGYRSRAPEPGEHDRELAAGWPDARPAPAAPPAPSPPLAGLRVLDFGIGGVGVEAGRLLAEYGADVIKIESRSYPDFIRVITGAEMSASFASSSRSKRSFGVNAHSEEGRAVLHRLVALSDVVIENGSTGTMDDMGVGYEQLRSINPRLVMVSSQLLGARGEWAHWIGYGPSTQPLSGLVHLWNYADRESPAGSVSIFPDHLAGRVVAVAALAGLLRRERTGAGAHAEVAQIEVAVGLLGDLLLEAGLEPGSVLPRGNRSRRGAPWGLYPCAGEQQWCAICVRDDADWAALRAALGDPAWARDRDLEHAAGRAARHDEIDRRLAEWTAQRSKREVAEALQARGVPAGMMLTGGEQIDDPHLRARGYPRPVEQQDLGAIVLEGPAFRATGMSDARIEQAPRLGEHTRGICAELLGMDGAEIDRLLASGALEGPPAAAADDA